MLKDKTIFYLLLVYVLLQLGTLFLGVGIFFFLYIIVYLIAIIYTSIKIAITITQNQTFTTFVNSVILFLIANAILFLIYLPTLIYNPEINWKLKGETEQDPMILQAYVPIIFFIAAALIISITVIISKLVLKYKRAQLIK
jgi:hypothetical protein